MAFTQTDRAWLKSMQAGALSGLNPTFVTNAVQAISDSHSRQYPWALWNAGPATAATALAETPLFTTQRQGKVRSATLVPAGNTAADGGSGNYALLTLAYRTAAGGGLTTVATWSTQTSAQGALSNLVSAAMALAASANLQVLSGVCRTWSSRSRLWPHKSRRRATI